MTTVGHAHTLCSPTAGGALTYANSQGKKGITVSVPTRAVTETTSLLYTAHASLRL